MKGEDNEENIYNNSCLSTAFNRLRANTVHALGNKTDKEKEKMLTFNVDGTAMRLEVCAEDIIRVQYFPGGEIADPGINTFTVDHDKDFIDYDVLESGGILTITTSRLRAEVEKASGKITYYDADTGKMIL